MPTNDPARGLPILPEIADMRLFVDMCVVLRALEWINPPSGKACPWCCHGPKDGHGPGCRLLSVLERLE